MCIITGILAAGGTAAATTAASSAAAFAAASAADGLLVAGATTAAGYASQRSQAAAQANYQNAQYSQVGDIARANYRQQLAATGVQLDQEQAAASDQLLSATAQSAAERGQANAVLSERGIAGNSVDILMNDFSRIDSVNRFNTLSNYQWRQTQATQDLASLRANAMSQIASSRPGPVNTPSLMGAFLEIGAAGYGAYDKYQYLRRSGPYKNVSS